jgi:hypothetical protein
MLRNGTTQRVLFTAETDILKDTPFVVVWDGSGRLRHAPDVYVTPDGPRFRQLAEAAEATLPPAGLIAATTGPDVMALDQVVLAPDEPVVEEPAPAEDAPAPTRRKWSDP